MAAKATHAFSLRRRIHAHFSTPIQIMGIDHAPHLVSVCRLLEIRVNEDFTRISYAFASKYVEDAVLTTLMANYKLDMKIFCQTATQPIAGTLGDALSKARQALPTTACVGNLDRCVC